MVSGLKVSKGRVTPIEAEIQDKIQIQAEMAEAEALQLLITLAAFQATTIAVLAMREADAEPISGEIQPAQEKCIDKDMAD